MDRPKPGRLDSGRELVAAWNRVGLSAGLSVWRRGDPVRERGVWEIEVEGSEGFREVSIMSSSENSKEGSFIVVD